MSRPRRVARLSLTSADPVELAGFYRRALGFEIVEDARATETASVLFAAAGCGGRVVSMRLGQESADLVNFSPMGRPYPENVPGWSPLFQHFAIVVADMAAAVARLRAEPGWRPITLGGPERLPQTSGGVTAFKFRDPEGHPLELLAFPEDSVPDQWRPPAGAATWLGIDHSALSVADTGRSVGFYGALGLGVASRSRNVGVEQARLDAVPDPIVEVTGLAFAGAGPPHLELLCYEGVRNRAGRPAAVNDVAATRLVIELESAAALHQACAAVAASLVVPARIGPQGGCAEALARDPDGHLLVLVSRGS